MSHQFSLSSVGLKLIKSYEGFRATPKRLQSGHKVIGYGHIVTEGDDDQKISPKKAEVLLLEDLAPVEMLVNDHIFAPMTQGQFDALCSLAFNIGATDFLKSDVVYALNNGRIIDAANGFDVWRKSEINGEIYVIDSLVRRRTSEKILFLRVEHAQPLASRRVLAPVADEDIMLRHLEEPERLHKDTGIVAPLLSVHKTAESVEVKPEELAPAALQPSPSPDKDVRDEVAQFENWLDDLSPDAPDTSSANVSNTDVEITAEDIDVPEELLNPESGAETVETSVDVEPEVEVELERAVEKSPVLMAASAVIGSKVLHDMSDEDDEKVETINFEAPLELDVPFEMDEQSDDDEIFEHERLISKTNPSPISDAAEDFRKRLDALMDNPTQINNDVDIEEDDAPEVEIPRSDLRPNNDAAARSHIRLVETDPEEEAFLSTTSTVLPQEIGEEVEIHQDSAGRFIESLPNADAAEKPAGRPYIIMMLCGLALIAASVVAMLTELDVKFGVAGLFASLVGLLFGFLLFLVAFYYWLKTRYISR